MFKVGPYISCLLIVLLGANLSSAAVYYVDPARGNDMYTGLVTEPNTVDFTGPKRTLTAAIQAAGPYDTVRAVGGVYSGAGNYNLDFQGKPLTVLGAEGPLRTMMDCGQFGRAARFISGEDANSVLQGFTIKNGLWSSPEMVGGTMRPAGGAIFCSGSAPRIAQCVFVNNQSSGFGVGGAVACTNASAPRFEHCEFISNFAELDAGAAYVDAGCHATFAYCNFQSNATGFGTGGAIYVYGSSAMADVSHSVISDNRAMIAGGGVFVTGIGAVASISHTLIAGNHAGEGGGLCVYDDGTIHLDHVTVAENMAVGSAASYGGGGRACGGAITVEQSIVWGNTSSGTGQSFSVGGATGASTLTAACCLIAGGIEQVDVRSSGVVQDDGATLNADPCFVMAGTWSESAGQWQWLEGDYHLQSTQGRWDPAVWTNADVNADGRVDLHDFYRLSRRWGHAANDGPEDFNDDGVVDFHDLLFFAGQFLTPGNDVGRWRLDLVDSVAIDAGDAAADWCGELFPHGKRVNLGVYGATMQASFSQSTAGNRADANRDGVVDMQDLTAVIEQWMNRPAVPLAADLDRDSRVNLRDFFWLSGNWLWQDAP